MKILILSYSFTGNNDGLAASLARALAAEHVRVTEPKHRSMGTIVFDMLLNRSPKIDVAPAKVEDYDLVLFVGPVWMGKAASPLRTCFKQFGFRLGKYAYVSISGGADGSNPKLVEDLEKRLGKKPAALIDLHIAELLPREPKPDRRATSSYRLTDKDLQVLAEKAALQIKKAVPE